MTISATDILVLVCSKIPLLYLLTQKVAQKFGYVLGIKKMSAFRSWCEQQGIDIEYAETIRMKWYRMRKAYQEKGINLFNLKRCKKDDFS